MQSRTPALTEAGTPKKNTQPVNTHRQTYKQSTHTHAPVKTTLVPAPTPTARRALATQPNSKDAPTETDCTRDRHDPEQTITHTQVRTTLARAPSPTAHGGLATQPNSQIVPTDTDYTDDRHDPSAVQRLDGFTLLP